MLKSLQKFKILQSVSLASYSLDLSIVKGLLVLSVILLHSLPLGLALFLIFFFNKPLLWSISGFLLKKVACDNGIYLLLKKPINGAIIPMFVAFIVYFRFAFNCRSTLIFFVYNVIYPFYHFWNVPASILVVIICFLVEKYKTVGFVILIITTCLIISCFLLYRNPTFIIKDFSWYLLGDNKLYSYLLVFYIGIAMRNGIINIRHNAVLLIFLIGLSLIGIIGVIFKGDQFFYFFAIPHVVLNSSLIFRTIIYNSSQNYANNKFIYFLNR